MAHLKPYIFPVLISLGFVLVSPMGLFVILLSGDSCCGENTTGTMVAVTAVILLLLAAVAVGIGRSLRDVRKDRATPFSVRVAALIMALPAGLIHVGFVGYLAVTAF